MSRLTFVALIAVSLLSRVCYAEDALSLKCSVDKPAEEKAAMSATGNAVKRIGKSELIVKAGGKTLHFRDKEPTEEPFVNGLTYRYCGQLQGYFLLSKQDSEAYGGILVNAQTGMITPAGSRIFFAADRRAFVAIEEPSCSDTEFWKVHAPSGQVSWEGVNFLSKTDQKFSFMIENPVWTETGELTATASCPDSQDKSTWMVTLTKSDDKWDWQPYRDCPR